MSENPECADDDAILSRSSQSLAIAAFEALIGGAPDQEVLGNLPLDTRQGGPGRCEEAALGCAVTDIDEGRLSPEFWVIPVLTRSSPTK